MSILPIFYSLIFFLVLFFGGFGLGAMLIPKSLKNAAFFIYPWIGLSLVCYLGFIIKYAFLYVLDPYNFLHIYFFISAYFIFHALFLDKASFSLSIKNLWLFGLFFIGTLLAFFTPMITYLPTTHEKTRYFVYYPPPNLRLAPASEVLSIGAPVVVDFFHLIVPRPVLISLNSILPSLFLWLCMPLLYWLIFHTKNRVIVSSAGFCVIYYLLLVFIYRFHPADIYFESILSAGFLISILILLRSQTSATYDQRGLAPVELLIALLLSVLSIVQPSAYLVCCLFSAGTIVFLWLPKMSHFPVIIWKAVALSILINPTAAALALKIFQF